MRADHNFWLSWYAYKEDGPYTLHSPWWVSGWTTDSDDEDVRIICAAVRAENEEAAKEVILAAHDTRPQALKWRFVEERPDDWSPFGDRFPKADWMQW